MHTHMHMLLAQNYFYESGLKMDVFGVSDLVQQTQTNYMWGEQQAPSVRGANLIVSLVHHHVMAKQAFAHDVLYAMADNCHSQNKNWAFLFYWRAFSTIFQTSVYYHFLLQGHTKALHDACFGLIKRALKKNTVHTPRDYFDLVQRSSDVNSAVDASGVHIGDMRSSLEEFFCEGGVAITRYRHFFFDKARPGIIMYRKDATDTWQEKSILRPDADQSVLSREHLDDTRTLPTSQLSQNRHKQLNEIVDKYFTGVPHKKRDFYQPPPKEVLAACPVSLPTDPDMRDTPALDVTSQ